MFPRLHSPQSFTFVVHAPPQPPQHEVIWRVIYYEKIFAAAGIRSGHGQRFRAKVRPTDRKSPPGGAVWPANRALYVVLELVIAHRRSTCIAIPPHCQ